MSPKKSMKARSRGTVRGAVAGTNGRGDIGRGSSAAAFKTNAGGPRARRVRSVRGSTELERDLEAQLRDAVAQLGLDSARRIFASLEAAFDV
jgi:hypothetical protein